MEGQVITMFWRVHWPCRTFGHMLVDGLPGCANIGFWLSVWFTSGPEGHRNREKEARSCSSGRFSAFTWIYAFILQGKSSTASTAVFLSSFRSQINALVYQNGYLIMHKWPLDPMHYATNSLRPDAVPCKIQCIMRFMHYYVMHYEQVDCTVLFWPTLQSLVTGVPQAELKRFSELSRITTGFEEIFPGTRKTVKRVPQILFLFFVCLLILSLVKQY